MSPLFRTEDWPTLPIHLVADVREFAEFINGFNVYPASLMRVSDLRPGQRFQVYPYTEVNTLRRLYPRGVRIFGYKAELFQAPAEPDHLNLRCVVAIGSPMALPADTTMDAFYIWSGSIAALNAEMQETAGGGMYHRFFNPDLAPVITSLVEAKLILSAF